MSSSIIFFGPVIRVLNFRVVLSVLGGPGGILRRFHKVFVHIERLMSVHCVQVEKEWLFGVSAILDGFVHVGRKILEVGILFPRSSFWAHDV